MFEGFLDSGFDGGMVPVMAMAASSSFTTKIPSQVRKSFPESWIWDSIDDGNR